MNIQAADLLAQNRSSIGRRQSSTSGRAKSNVAGHVPGAMHIPFWAIGSRASEIRSAVDRPVVVYCGHGPRAWMAGALLGLRGFRHLVYVEGHWAGWQRQGLREETGA